MKRKITVFRGRMLHLKGPTTVDRLVLENGARLYCDNWPLYVVGKFLISPGAVFAPGSAPVVLTIESPGGEVDGCNELAVRLATP